MICFSSASILRCDSLTRNQNIFLIIPTALEVIFSTSLALIDRGPGKRNLLLTAEGLFFLTLVVLEILIQTLPAVRENLRLFKGFDLAIGIASFLPISLYTSFLCLLTNAEIVSALPRRLKNFTKLALILFIPLICIFNEIASFIGVSIRNAPPGETPETVITVFFNSTQQGLWTFFTSLTLALLTGFQVAVFCLAFFRLTQAILDQRRIESQQSDKAHLIKGIAWINASVKLGVIETVVGFAGGGFAVVLIRRIFRLLARASLCIGVAKGVDLVEDFRAIRHELSRAGLRRSRIREYISNPRLSTFHQLSPKATSFHAAQQTSDTYDKLATYRTTLTTAGLPGMVHFANVRAQKGHQRVTVQYNRGAPSLHLRFSKLGFPTTVEEPQNEPDAHLPRPQPSFHQSLQFRDSADSTTSFAGPFELVTAPRRTLSQRSARARVYQATSSARSGESLNPDPTPAQDPGRVQSVRSLPDSLQAVHDLAGQFPGPPMAFKDQNTYIKPSLGDSTWSSNRSSPNPSFGNRSSRSSGRPTLYSVTGTTLKSAPLYAEKPIDPFNDDDDVGVRSPSSPAVTNKAATSDATVSGFRQGNALQDPEPQDSDGLDLTTALDNRASQQSQSEDLQSSRQESPHKSDEQVARTKGRMSSISNKAIRRLPQAETNKLIQRSHEGEDMSSINRIATVPWLKNSAMEEEDRRLLRTMSKRDMPLYRVKSVGKAPRRSTPLPMQVNHRRGSTHLNPIIIPPRGGGDIPEIVDEYEYGNPESLQPAERY